MHTSAHPIPQHFGPNWLQKAPMLRLLVPFMAGILLQYHFSITFLTLLVGGLGGCLLLTAFQLLPLAWRYHWFWVKGCILQFIFIVLGMSVYTLQVQQTQPAPLLQPGKQEILVQFDEPLTERDKTYKGVATLQQQIVKGRPQMAKGKIILYFQKDTALLRHIPAIQAGTLLLMQATVQPIANSGNPGAFNYIAWCHRKGIYYQSFVPMRQCVVVTGGHLSTLQTTLWQLRKGVLQILDKYIPDKDARGVAAALLIGYRNYLDRELVQAYSNVGVVHIIAISGLHLGMIYGLLFFLLAPLERSAKWRPVKYCLMLSVIWLFTAIAGGVPSIARSAVMFSFIILGQWLNRNTHIYNNLAASAFFLLLYNPFNLWDVGFQLSYAAVLSIVLFQPIIQQQLNWPGLLKKIGQLMAITLAAQILTLPISWYHFHQFPVYFLLANIWVVPLSGLLLYGLMALLLVHSWPAVAVLFGKFLNNGIEWMNAGITAIDHWPHAVWGGIQINAWQTGCVIIVIAGMGYWFLQKKIAGIYWALLATLLFAGIRSADLLEKQQQTKLIVYQVPKTTAIDIIQGRNCRFIGAPEFLQNGYLRNFHLQPSRILHRIQTIQVLDTQLTAPKIITLQQKQIVWLNNRLTLPSLPAPSIHPEVVILSQNPNVSLLEIHRQWPCKQFVADGSNSLWKINQWKKEAEALHLRLHSIPESGAFTLNL
ncbi:MAG: DUF4131 domain-containing protein [Hydrotalea flava]|nr:DUF4131 domain-containing protein [Hydrotalea flava]NIM37764.1 DUF4131 domain-containing protein [Hydrotalea flava]NIN02933.1 DUF4131 domain-containing protein [Hydrotalea flava]NIN14618.1 DUF4131 domain-containing protein [Hydrotalea flava]NIO93690.1 DUF4131 domain-containing protein [Hydrotalea flava]